MPGMATFTTHRIFLFCACLLFLAPLLTSAVPSRSSLRLPSSSFPSHENVGRPIQSYKRPWTRLRDSIIQHSFGLPKNNNDEVREQAGRRPTNAEPPANLLAKYGGDVVLRFNVSSVDEATALSEASKSLILDVWEFTDEWVDIRLAKDMIPSLIGLLPTSLHHAHTPLMHDLAQTIYESYPSPMFGSDSSGPSGSQSPSRHAFTPALRTSNEMSDNLFFQNYQPLSVIHPWMRLLKSLFPTHVRLINIGISYEGRDIPALRVGVHPTNSQEPSKPRKTIIVTGGSHAREWISVSSINYIAYTLITSYGKSKSITKLVENFDFVFIPTLNPDGYEYTWKNDRLWRKNRQQTSLRFCRGLDIDRSWNYQWDGETTRGNPCSESYAGEAPFEAVESRRFADWINNETESGASKIVGYLDLHSYSQQVLYPYSYTCTMSPPSLENLEELAIGLAKAIRLSSGENYGVRSACEGNILAGSKEKEKSHLAIRMESGGGSALDWFYGVHHVRYSYQMKLRDTGSYGFLLPRENIIPTGKEAFEALAYLGRFLLSNKGIEESLEPGQPEEPDKKTEEPVEKVVSDWELRRRRR